MSLEVVNAVWQELARHMGHTDKVDSAETIVAILIDYDYEASEISEEFANDSLIKEALSSYLMEEEEDEEAYEELDFDEEEDEEY